ncbi:MAG: hydrogenase iron-sulfur subunit [Candidatus Hodarchaeota archaeon]
MAKGILVIGGGITGIQTSLDLAEMGLKVYLVEFSPSIGGKMAQLDKTFPTNDCSICIIAPKMVECARHPNITILSYSEIKEIYRKDREFLVKILKKPRYVDEKNCTGCRACFEVCPIEVPNEFDLNLRNRNAIYIPFPQAVPNIAIIDMENCINCGVCSKRCKTNAINYEQQPKFIELEVHSIIVSIGFDLFDPSVISHYGYKKFKNVLISLEFERLLSASGPTQGEILSLSDGKTPEHITFIQCVGSRNTKYKPYCSKICCTYTTKEAIVTKEHNPNIQISILYNDLRAMGKGFREFINRGETEYGINYIKALPGEITEDPITNKLYVSYENINNGESETIATDMVILAPAMVPQKGIEQIAKILDIKLDKYGFFKCEPYSPLVTNIPGIYVTGTCSGPKDIPESVGEGSGGAGSALISIDREPKSTLDQQQKLESFPTAQPRIGVFICHCGVNIGGVVNIKEVAEYTRSLNNVVFVAENLYTCSEDAQKIIQDKIRELNLTRCIVASCTPSTHESLFRKTCEEAGLNPYLFDLANIREQNSWVHQREPEKATEKAKDIIRMYVKRAQYSSPLAKIRTEVTSSALVIGGGISGLIASKTIADKGFKVFLIEKEDKLGGLIKDLFKLYPNEKNPEDILNPILSDVRNNKKIEVLTSTKINDITGSIGNFEISADRNNKELKFKVGTIIAAIGAIESKPEGLYGYRKKANVYTQSEFEQILRSNEVKNDEKIAMILCAGVGKGEKITYCSSICCMEAFKNALIVKKQAPNSEITILYKDICVFGDGEEVYRTVREEGIQFIKYNKKEDIKILGTDENKTNISVFNSLLNKDVNFRADRIVLSTPIVPAFDTKEFSKLLRVPLAYNGFFLEAHVKHRPLDFTNDGIYLCGACQSPKSISECIAQAKGAAGRALIPLIKGEVESEAIISEVNSKICVGCEICELHCPYGAITVQKDENDDLKAQVNPSLCKGCGICAASCPVEAITMKNFTNEQILSMVQTAKQESSLKDETMIIAFLCNWCSYAGADNAGVSRFQYPTSIRPIRVMCTGRISINHILNAFKAGADGVLIAGCHSGDCHYIDGNLNAERKVNLAKQLLNKIGINERRLRLEWISASEGNKFASVVKDFLNELEEIKTERKMIVRI